MVITLILISLSILITYIVMVIKELGYIPSSVSSTYYTLKHKYWFGIAMVSSSILLMPGILEITPESYQFTAFLACLGMIIVGTAPNFKEETERIIHAIGAVLVLLFSQIWVTLTDPWFLFPWIIYIMFTIKGINDNWTGEVISSFEKTNPLFWIEIVCILTTYSLLLVKAIFP